MKTIIEIAPFAATRRAIVRAAAAIGRAMPTLPVQPERQKLTDELYNELLFAVGNKYPNETRHQTALRYIQEAETCGAQLAKAHNIGAKP